MYIYIYTERNRETQRTEGDRERGREREREREGERQTQSFNDQWVCSDIYASQQQPSPTGFLSYKPLIYNLYTIYTIHGIGDGFTAKVLVKDNIARIFHVMLK